MYAIHDAEGYNGSDAMTVSGTTCQNQNIQQHR